MKFRFELKNCVFWHVHTKSRVTPLDLWFPRALARGRFFLQRLRQPGGVSWVDVNCWLIPPLFLSFSFFSFLKYPVKWTENHLGNPNSFILCGADACQMIQSVFVLHPPPRPVHSVANYSLIQEWAEVIATFARVCVLTRLNQSETVILTQLLKIWI